MHRSAVDSRTDNITTVALLAVLLLSALLVVWLAFGWTKQPKISSAHRQEFVTFEEASVRKADNPTVSSEMPTEHQQPIPQIQQPPSRSQDKPTIDNNMDTFATLEAAVRRYAKIHKEQLELFEANGTGRFVIIWPFGGLGNRLLPTLTGFLVGLLTDRALLVNWKPHESSRKLGEMFDMQAAGFNWDLQSFPKILAKFEENYCKSNPHDVDYIPEGEDVFARFRDIYACEKFDDLWQKQVVSQTACQYTLPLILHNPHYRKILDSWGIGPGDDDDTFGRLAHFLLQPGTEISEKVDAFASKYFSSTMIGAQVRMKNWAVHAGGPVCYWGHKYLFLLIG